MIASARQNYGGRWLYRGDVFAVADDSEADDMEAMHIAYRADEIEQPQEYKREDMQTTSSTTAKGRQRGRYRNRNLKATL